MRDDILLETLLEVKATQTIHGQILDKHSDSLDKMNAILLRNTVIVDEHQRRSTLLEEELRNVKSDVDSFKAKKVAWLSVGKVIAGVISVVGSLAYAAWYILKLFGIIGV